MKPRGKRNPPPIGEPWVWMTAELLKSDAWWSLSRAGHRFVTFLMVELMAHGGTNNGLLKAPHDQLAGRVSAEPHLPKIIREAQDIGLVDCIRQGWRGVPSLYALTWLPLHDGTPATQRWRLFRNPALKAWPTRERPAE